MYRVYWFAVWISYRKRPEWFWYSFQLFHHRFGHRLTVFSWFNVMLSVPSQNAYICFFLSRNKIKTSWFFSLGTNYSLTYKHWVWCHSSTCLFYWCDICCLRVGVLSLREIIHLFLGLVCLYSGGCMLFRLWSHGPKGKAFPRSECTWVYNMFLIKVKGRILFIRNYPWNCWWKTKWKEFPGGCMLPSQGIEGKFGDSKFSIQVAREWVSLGGHTWPGSQEKGS